VWDVSGLYVADGSTFPTPSGVNPMIAIYGVSHLIAQGIAAKWRAGAEGLQQQLQRQQQKPVRQQIPLKTLAGQQKQRFQQVSSDTAGV
jgi:choline dehydrogenase-like flavoprotein